MADTEITTDVLDELRALRGRMDEIYALVSGQSRVPEPTRAGDIVFVEYVQRVTGLSRVTILQGKAGTAEIPLQGKRPKRWFKSDVDRWQRNRARLLMSPKQKALRIVEKKRA